MAIPIERNMYPMADFMRTECSFRTLASPGDGSARETLSQIGTSHGNDSIGHRTRGLPRSMSRR